MSGIYDGKWQQAAKLQPNNTKYSNAGGHQQYAAWGCYAAKESYTPGISYAAEILYADGSPDVYTY
jgi:hypothetical protein